MKNLLNNGSLSYGSRNTKEIGLESFNRNFSTTNYRRNIGNMSQGDFKDLITAGRVYRNCCEFLRRSRLVLGSESLLDAEHLGDTIGVKEIDSSFTNENGETINPQEVQQLVEDSGVPEEDRETAEEEVATLLSRFIAARGNAASFRRMHFISEDKELSDNIRRNFTQYYSGNLFNELVSSKNVPGFEAFGANIDTVLPDLRDSLAITLLQFHRGLLNRIMHRRSTPSPYIRYTVPYAEVYDMLKSNDADDAVRNEGSHRIPFIDLYGDPRAVTNALTPVIPLTSNDTHDLLYKDGFVKPNVDANLFTLSLQAGKLGNSHVNYTDLLSENVVMDKIVIKLHMTSSNPADETIIVDVRQVNSSRFLMPQNTNDSGNREAYLNYTIRLDKNTKTATGAPSQILAKCTDTDFLRVNLRMFSTINLKTADITAMGNVVATAYNINQSPVIDTNVTNLVKDLTITIEGYKVDACYSEENLRKSNLAVRYHMRTFDFEVSNGRNILVDYSMNEDIPEFLMSVVSEASSLGQDHRGLDVIVKELLHVYDTTNEENRDPNFRKRLDKTGFQYVSAQQVRPVVYLNTIDLENVDWIRSGDYLGDIRAYVETCLLNLTSLYFQNSFFRQQLSPGTQPKFKVITSSVILDNLFSVPHYHNHLNKETPCDGTNVEYCRVLPNGVILECVSCTYNYMRDKIVIIPYVDNAESILSWGHNWDFGQFVAHYAYQNENEANKRVIANQRCQVIPTNPSGLYLSVKHISTIMNMHLITAPMHSDYASSLPNPSDLIDPSAKPTD